MPRRRSMPSRSAEQDSVDDETIRKGLSQVECGAVAIGGTDPSRKIRWMARINIGSGTRAGRGRTMLERRPDADLGILQDKDVCRCAGSAPLAAAHLLVPVSSGVPRTARNWRRRDGKGNHRAEIVPCESLARRLQRAGRGIFSGDHRFALFIGEGGKNRSH